MASPLAPVYTAIATGGPLPARLGPMGDPPPTTTTLAPKRTPGPLTALTQDAGEGVGDQVAAALVAAAEATTAQRATPSTKRVP